MNGRAGQPKTHSTHSRFRPWILTAFLFFVGQTSRGCGPTKEQILQYELVLAVVGLVLGLAIVLLGRRIAYRGKWFVCSHCLKAQTPSVKDAQMQVCPLCGKETLVTYLPKRDLAAVVPKDDLAKKMGRKRAAILALLLATGTLAVFSALSGLTLLVRGDGYAGYNNIALFPISFILCGTGRCLGLGWGYAFVNFSAFTEFLSSWPLSTPEIPSIVFFYLLFLLILSSLWYIGLRRWQRGWLIPVAMQLVNVGLAICGYYWNWG